MISPAPRDLAGRANVTAHIGRTSPVPPPRTAHWYRHRNFAVRAGRAVVPAVEDHDDVTRAFGFGRRRVLVGRNIHPLGIDRISTTAWTPCTLERHEDGLGRLLKDLERKSS